MSQQVSGSYVELAGESFYKISNVDQMPPFFVSVVSDQDHWLFAGSTGGLTMGRVSPDTAVFPYVTVDKIYESTPHTGPKTLFRVPHKGATYLWEPLNREHDERYSLSRHLYKNKLGNVLCFEEINHDLQLAFRYFWRFSKQNGIVRVSEVENLADSARQLDVLDGLQNILPAGTPRFTQTQSSNLVDAYKWTELDSDNTLALFTLYSAITDRAEPVESLNANTVFSVGAETANIHVSVDCVEQFRNDQLTDPQSTSRGVRGCYFIEQSLNMASNATKQWSIVVDVEQDQSDIIALQLALEDKENLAQTLQASYQDGSDNLARIMAAADGFQVTGEEDVSLHHYANTLFNVMRGGIFANQYSLSRRDILNTLKHFNRDIYTRHKAAIEALPEAIPLEQLHSTVERLNDYQLTRLIDEYLPITFGRRHGDPSRPWNQFAIELNDERGNPLLSYQGNWRDIFQNWEALTLSYPNFIESVIAKFVNASTVDGYNPYRITKQGIDWEVEEPDDPWSYIGYWGDHQIIYLLKLLESSYKFHPGKLNSLLERPIFCYANVPYRIKDFDNLVKSPKATVTYDNTLADIIEQRTQDIGADGKLVLNANAEVYQVNLIEKLCVPLLTKLSNLVIDGGIWLNTQRPEWNDANNALVGQGLSMVTLYYMNRYLTFMQQLLSDSNTSTEYQMTSEVAQWLDSSLAILKQSAAQLPSGRASAELQFDTLKKLGVAASEYRQSMYQHNGDFSQATVQTSSILNLVKTAQDVIRHSIEQNLTKDGLYHAYNILSIDHSSLEVDHLYDMLEGQVAALSSGAVDAKTADSVLDRLFAGDMYRADQKTFMLYPDRKQQSFLSKNCIPSAEVNKQPILTAMLKQGDNRIVKRDVKGNYRFNSKLVNAGAVLDKWPVIREDYPELATDKALQQLLQTYEQVFNHSAFTGRSGGMFGFEGLGCIYWHMVSKLLLAVQEIALQSIAEQGMSATSQSLVEHYYRVREGIGFNKTPEEYGAFPADPYSHTPKHAGAQQPGMTGQVKEEIITRMGELGCVVEQGEIRFVPVLLRQQEFSKTAQSFTYLDTDDEWQTIDIPANSLGFTWCQVPIVYTLSDEQPGITVLLSTGQEINLDGVSLDAKVSADIFQRTGSVKQIQVTVSSDQILTE